MSRFSFMRGSRSGDSGSGSPLRNYKALGFLTCSNTGPDPLEKRQSYQATCSIFQCCWAIINGVSLAGRWRPAVSVIWVLSPIINYKTFMADDGPLLVAFESSLPSAKTFLFRACPLFMYIHVAHARIQKVL